VPQELMHHASIQTTMSIYGQAMLLWKREANGKFVEMVLKPFEGERRISQFCSLECMGVYLKSPNPVSERIGCGGRI
jgi:hypothetical protein